MITDKGYRRTVISFAPMHALMRNMGISDLQLARRIGVKVDVIRNIQLHPEVTMDTIRAICEELKCSPGDIMRSTEVHVIPAKTSEDK